MYNKRIVQIIKNVEKIQNLENVYNCIIVENKQSEETPKPED